MDRFDSDMIVSAAWLAEELTLSDAFREELERRCGAVARLGDYGEALALMQGTEPALIYVCETAEEYEAAKAIMRSLAPFMPPPLRRESNWGGEGPAPTNGGGP
jgi:hypothetical protein